jgi:hypothetical protein
MSDVCKFCNILKRNEDIFNQYLLGDSYGKIAEQYGISPARVSNIVHTSRRRRDLFDLSPWSTVGRDEHISMYGTWAQKVSLLIPHIPAIRAIAEENT